MKAATKILCIVFTILLFIVFIWGTNGYFVHMYPVSEMFRPIGLAFAFIVFVCLALFAVAGILVVLSKHAADQKIAAAFVITLVAITFFTLWSGAALLTYKEIRDEEPPEIDSSSYVNMHFKLLRRLESIELYTMSDPNYYYDNGTFSALVMFRNSKVFPLDWQCDAYSNRERTQMMLNKNYDENGNDELWVSLYAWSDTEKCFEDLHVVQFEEIYEAGREYPVDAAMTEYTLKGEDVAVWFNEPISWKDNAVLFAGKEYPVSLSGTSGAPRTVSYGSSVQFSMNQESKEVLVHIYVYAEHPNGSEIQIGLVNAKVLLQDGVFSLSNFNFIGSKEEGGIII